MSLVVEWSPSEGGLLFTAPETSGGIQYAFSAAAFTEQAPAAGAGDDDGGGEPVLVPVAVSGYGYTLSPEPPVPILVLEASDSGVTLSASTLAGLFPIECVDYLLAGELTRVARWEDVPPHAEEIVAFRAGTTAAFTFTLEVTALAGDEPIAQSWTFTITRDWTAGKIRLQEEVNARR